MVDRTRKKPTADSRQPQTRIDRILRTLSENRELTPNVPLRTIRKLRSGDVLATRTECAARAESTTARKRAESAPAGRYTSSRSVRRACRMRASGARRERSAGHRRHRSAERACVGGRDDRELGAGSLGRQSPDTARYRLWSAVAFRPRASLRGLDRTSERTALICARPAAPAGNYFFVARDRARTSRRAGLGGSGKRAIVRLYPTDDAGPVAPQVAFAPNGTIVDARPLDGWTRIRLPSGTMGWVRSEYLVPILGALGRRIPRRVPGPGAGGQDLCAAYEDSIRRSMSKAIQNALLAKCRTQQPFYVSPWAMDSGSRLPSLPPPLPGEPPPLAMTIRGYPPRSW
jgi:hypothetical protein